MTTFDERERGYEAKFARDEALRFKATARRNRSFGFWAAGLLGLGGDEAEAYAKDAIRADFLEPGDEGLIAKVMGDFKAKGVAMTDSELRKKLHELMGQALADLEAGK